MKQFFVYYNIKQIRVKPHNTSGQVVIERSNWTLKDMLNKQKWVIETTKINYNDLITLNFINANEKWITPVKRHWNIEKKNYWNKSDGIL